MRHASCSNDAMNIPLQVTLQEPEDAEAAQRCIRRELELLERVQPSIAHCHVTLGVLGRHGRSVHVAMTLPDGEVAIDHETDFAESGAVDPYVAIRESFVAARRALLVHARRIRAESPRAARASVASDQPSAAAVGGGALTEIS